MKLERLLNGIGVKSVQADLSLDITDITSDSRSSAPGSLFVALKGERSDGNAYIGAALSKGAVCVVTQSEPENGVPYILVENARSALSQMLCNFYGRPQESFEHIIGITGTNGKTSTSIMLKNIFESAGCKVGLIGTVKYLIGDEEFNSESDGNHLTTPDSENLWRLLSLMRDKGVRVLIMEVSSHALALNKVDGIEFDCAVFTNLTRDHLDFHGDFDSYFEAKSRLFAMSKIGIVNLDDEAGARLGELALCDIKTYSIDSIEGDFTAKNIKLKGALGIEYELLTRGTIFRIRVDIPGKFTVYNSLAAASAALSLGLGTDEIVRGFERTYRIDGRIDRVDIDAPYSVIIDFAHTPDAMENVLETVKGFAKGRIITLFGCGGDRDKTKRPIMGRLATELSDFAIVTADNCRTEKRESIFADIVAGIEKDNYMLVPDRREAIHRAMDMAEENDIILCLGKGHEEYEIDEHGKHAFSEREIVTEYWLND